MQALKARAVVEAAAVVVMDGVRHFRRCHVEAAVEVAVVAEVQPELPEPDDKSQQELVVVGCTDVECTLAVGKGDTDLRRRPMDDAEEEAEGNKVAEDIVPRRILNHSLARRC